MRHIDEIQIAGTAILLCGAMFAVSAVAPTGNTVSKAATNFAEAPETAAEAQAQAEAQAEEDGFTIYTQESNYDDSDYDNSYNDISYDDSSYNTDTTQDSSLDDTGQENDNTDTGDGSSDVGTVIRHRLTIQGMILPIRLIIPAMTIPVTRQMVLWIALTHGKITEKKSVDRLLIDWTQDFTLKHFQTRSRMDWIVCIIIMFLFLNKWYNQTVINIQEAFYEETKQVTITNSISVPSAVYLSSAISTDGKS